MGWSAKNQGCGKKSRKDGILYKCMRHDWPSRNATGTPHCVWFYVTREEGEDYGPTVTPPQAAKIRRTSERKTDEQLARELYTYLRASPGVLLQDVRRYFNGNHRRAERALRWGKKNRLIHEVKINAVRYAYFPHQTTKAAIRKHILKHYPGAQEVYEAMNPAEPLTVEQIADRLGTEPRRTYNGLYRLQALGYAYHHKHPKIGAVRWSRIEHNVPSADRPVDAIQTHAWFN